MGLLSLSRTTPALCQPGVIWINVYLRETAGIKPQTLSAIWYRLFGLSGSCQPSASVFSSGLIFPTYRSRFSVRFGSARCWLNLLSPASECFRQLSWPRSVLMNRDRVGSSLSSPRDVSVDKLSLQWLRRVHLNCRWSGCSLSSFRRIRVNRRRSPGLRFRLSVV